MKAYVINKCRGDILLKSIDPTFEFYIGKSLELIHVRSSSSAQNFRVDDFMPLE